MSILIFRASTFARNIVMFGKNRLTSRDGYPGVTTEYYSPVEQYIRYNFTETDISNALSRGWISQEEYDEIMAL